MKKQLIVLAMLVIVGLPVFGEDPRGFHDHFGSHSLKNWEQSGSNWHIQARFLAVISQSRDSLFIRKDYTSSDFIIESAIEVRMSRQTSRGGMMFRVDPDSSGEAISGYFAGINPNQNSLVLAKIENGRETVLAEASIPEEDYGCYLRVQAHGDRIRVFYNNEPKIDIRDNTFRSGKTGLRVQEAILESVWMIAVDNNDASRTSIKGEDWNYLAFNSDIKDFFAQYAREDLTFGPTAFLGTNFSPLKDFVDQKVAGISSPINRAAALYDWVVNNVYYDRDAGPENRGVKSVMPIDVFSKRITNCNGYAALYATFLNLAGIPAIFSGGPVDTDGNSDYGGDHTWVEAYIDGQWRIMDPTFDSYNAYHNGQKVERINRNQWVHFDAPLSRFSRFHRIDRYFVQPGGHVIPPGDLSTDECVVTRQQGSPKAQKATLLDSLAGRGDHFYWRDYGSERELTVIPEGRDRGKIVFRNINAGEESLWRLVPVAKNSRGHHLVRIQSVINERFVQLVGEDKIGSYLELSPNGAIGEPGTVFELDIKDDGSLHLFTPQRGFLMTAGSDSDARLQRAAYWNTPMGRFNFVIAGSRAP